MRRMIGRLTELQVQRADKGWHNDGGGLYLRVAGRKQRWWVFRYGAGGKRYHGLGPLHTIGLAEARERARQCRKLLLDGADPISAGRARRAAVALEAASAKTFAECVDAYYEAHCVAWTNQKHAKEWKVSLKAHVLPEIGALPVGKIDTPQVMRVLEPAWTKIPETATRLRSRIESVLDWAKVKGYRDGENPARWRGHLDHLLPARKKVARVRHHPALPYRELPAFMRRLREHEDVEAHALEFIILTAARAGETVAAVWSEIDQADAAGWTWVVPPERMKARREHRIPLSKAARALLERTLRERRRGYLFPNATQRGKAVTVIALWRLTQELTGGTASTHGFRATFRSWAGEQTNFAREVAELALAHRVGDDTELAYLRGDLLKKRRQLMEAWARYCASPSVTAASDVVVPMGTGRRG